MSKNSQRIPVGILGATGMVGQQYLKLLQNHPWFEPVFLAASKAHIGKSYSEALAGRWHHSGSVSEELGALADIQLHSIDEIDAAKKKGCLIFSALTDQAAAHYEPLYAAAGLPLISNGSGQRMVCDVPLIIPEVNGSHIELIKQQRLNRGSGEGFILVKPNCTLQSFVIALTPLHRAFGLRQAVISTMQAISGAGYPGVSAYDILGNIIPYIEQEENKSEQEPLKIWGKLTDKGIDPAKDIHLSVHAHRVPVLEGHLATVSVAFEKKPTESEILECWSTYKGLEQPLPSSPASLITYFAEPDRPQPRFDSGQGRGMGISVGRLRRCPVLDYRFVCLSHNTIRGAAGGAILSAELLVEKGYISRNL